MKCFAGLVVRQRGHYPENSPQFNGFLAGGLFERTKETETALVRQNDPEHRSSRFATFSISANPIVASADAGSTHPAVQEANRPTW
jgi:hypothetical protein